MTACCRVLLLVSVLAPSAIAQITSFEAAPSSPVSTTSGESFDVAWGDIDGDGDADLLVVNGNGPSANHLHRNEGGGSFTRITDDPLVTSLGNSTAAGFADVDGDGDLDVFVTNRGGSDNQLFINQGGQQGGTQGTYLEAQTGALVADGGDSMGLAFLDLEGDGDADVFVANGNGQSNALYTNQGGAQGGVEGTYLRVQGGPAVTDTADSMDVVAADLDGDGATDLYVANDAGQNNFLLFNDGSGNLTPQPGGTNDGARSQAAAAGDIDGDGDIDLVVANFLENNAVYVNMGGRQLGTEGVFQLWYAGAASTDESPSFDIDLADWDNDGHLDLVVANCCTNDNLLYVGDGQGRFHRIINGPVVTDGGYSMAVAFSDYDRDGGIDLVVANRSTSGDTEFLYRNRSSGTWTARTVGHPVVEPHRAFDVEAGDIDGDGDVDLFASTKEGETSALYVNLGGLQGGAEGSFTRRTDAPLGTDVDNASAAAFGDVDGDGDLDLAIANRTGSDNALYLNQGGYQGNPQGDYVPLETDPVSSQGGSSRDVRMADIDADGDLDLFFANSGNENNFLYRNAGSIRRETMSLFDRDLTDPLATDGGRNYGADFGDVDGDGDLDVFVASRQGEDNWLYVNLGGHQGSSTGEFARAPAAPVTNSGGDTYAGTWGDLDNDGDLDLYVANNGKNFLYRNLGGAQDGPEGTFAAITEDVSVASSHSSRRAEWGDIDDDGDLDLFVPNTTADNELFRNRGDGQFVAMSTAIAADDGGNSRGAVFVDVDGDDDLDLAVANYEGPMGLYLNNGPVGPPLFTNLGHALPGLAEPILGGNGKLISQTPVRLQVVEAVPNALAYLFLGAQVINAHLLGGVLVPSPDLVVGGLVTNSNGVMVLDGTWPDVPAGIEISFQVWIADPQAPQGFSATNGLQALAQ